MHKEIWISAPECPRVFWPVPNRRQVFQLYVCAGG